jgi:hypothetical protein
MIDTLDVHIPPEQVNVPATIPEVEHGMFTAGVIQFVPSQYNDPEVLPIKPHDVPPVAPAVQMFATQAKPPTETAPAPVHNPPCVGYFQYMPSQYREPDTEPTE